MLGMLQDLTSICSWGTTLDASNLSGRGSAFSPFRREQRETDRDQLRSVLLSPTPLHAAALQRGLSTLIFGS